MVFEFSSANYLDRFILICTQFGLVTRKSGTPHGLTIKKMLMDQAIIVSVLHYEEECI